jgi:hypothetical protein
MEYSAAKLGAALSTRENCPTLESIIGATLLGIDAQVLESGSLAAISPVAADPEEVPSGLLPISSAVSAPTTLSSDEDAEKPRARLSSSITVLPNSAASSILPAASDSVSLAAANLVSAIVAAANSEMDLDELDPVVTLSTASPKRHLNQKVTTTTTTSTTATTQGTTITAQRAAAAIKPPVNAAAALSATTNAATAAIAAAAAAGKAPAATSTRPSAALTGSLSAGNLTGAILSKRGPTIKISFMFGFSANKTFPYGKYGSVTVPATGVKFTVEANNW